MVTFLAPLAAAVVSSVRVTCVGSVNVTPVTDTPPDTSAAMWFAKPGPPGSAPGSKKPEPDDEVPVMTTLTDGRAPQTAAGAADAGAAGGGARSWTTRTAQLFVGESAYSCTVQTVWSSFGSTSVNE